MSKQYFDNNQQLAHHEKTIQFKTAQATLQLTTDNGVFSKNQVDYGSRVLMDTVIEQESANVASVLELGSGYGPIILSLAKYFKVAQLYGVEINERAYELSKQNALHNQIEHVTFFCGDATAVTLAEQVELVVTNPPIRAGKAVIQAFVARAFELMLPQARLYVVIQKKQGAPSMSAYMEQIFGNVEKVTQDKGYWILRSVKA